MTVERLDVGNFADNQKIGAFHVVLLISSFLVMATDGFDLGAAAFAGPSLIRDFGVGPAALGPLFSAGLVAGLFGPVVFGYLADRFGRKRIVLAAAVFFGTVTLATLLATSFLQVLVLRFIAGLGMSGMLPVVIALNSEFAPRRFRATLVVLMFCGVTLGNGLPGLVTAHMSHSHDWRLLFWIGGLMPIALAIVLFFVLPESVRFLARRPARRPELVAILRRMQPGLQIDQTTEFFLADPPQTTRVPLRALFTGRLALLTPLFWVANFCSLMVFYFINQWMPTLLSGSHVTVGQAAIATTLFQFGGTIGGLAIMRPLDRWGFLPVPLFFAAAIPILVSTGTPGITDVTIMALLFCAGFCLLGLQFGLIASEGPVFPSFVRASGVGTCFAAGRVGSALGPLIGGVMIARKWPLQDIFIAASAPLVLGLVITACVTPIYRRHMREIANSLAGVDPATDAAVKAAVPSSLH